MMVEKRFLDYRDESMVRMRDPSTGRYLHLSGEGDTDKIAYAWLGYRRQAKVLRDRALQRGEAFPFKAQAR